MRYYCDHCVSPVAKIIAWGCEKMHLGHRFLCESHYADWDKCVHLCQECSSGEKWHLVAEILILDLATGKCAFRERTIT